MKSATFKSPSEKEELDSEQLFEISANLLIPHETVRDPIHGDIWITLMEREIIDTPTFQRLRGISQLGPTSVVYPGAIHTRFLHSLGTLHVAEQFVGICNRNERISRKGKPANPVIGIPPYPHLLIRLSALLHDVAHIPFGHTLEDEGNLMPPEWEDEVRAKRFIGPDSEIQGRIRAVLEKFNIPNQFVRTLLTDLWEVVTFKGDPFDLKYPYVFDLVGNTICADLWDYIERDMYFCGLKERSGDRFLNHLAIVSLEPVDPSLKSSDHEVFRASKNGKGRTVLLAYRYERDREDVDRLNLVPKPDVLSEAIDLLRRRYSLAEKVYFHRTKIAASSMLISATSCAERLNKDTKLFYEMGDAQFLQWLCGDTNERTKSLAKSFCTRNLFKPVYRIDYKPAREMDPDSKHLWDTIYPRYRKEGLRKEKELALEKEFRLPPGSVSIYCPDRDMNLKPFDVLVALHPEDEVKPLRHILDETRHQEMQAIQTRFQHLWNLIVFVNPLVLDPTQPNHPKVQNLGGACESSDYFGLPNDIRSLRGCARRYQERVATEVAREWDAKHPSEKVHHSTYQELLASQRGPGEGTGIDYREYIEKKLKEIMQSKRKK